jgi:dienelactone hydrolase
VGFRQSIKNDYTRSYKRLYDWDNKILPRPMSISVWYPAAKGPAKEQLKVKDYMTILKQEEEWEALPNDRILNWFYYADNDKNRKHLEIARNVYKNEKAATGKFPVVIYAPSYQASSVENFILCEFLASHGYLVLSTASRGTDNRFLDGGTTRDIETQSRDIEFLIAEATALPNADSDNLSLIGFSFGGISNVLAQMKDERVKALVCLDGTVKYQFEKLMASSYGNMDKVDVPFMFMAQKDIPMPVMLAENIDTTLNRKFVFFDSLKYSQAYYLKFNQLTHSYFSSMGILFQDRDLRQDKSDDEIIGSYKWVCQYTLSFLNAFCKTDEEALKFLNRDPTENGVAADVISIKRKKPLKPTFSFKDFNLLARKQAYQDLDDLLTNLKQNNPNLVLEEWKLNNLGLQLLFQGKVREGISVLTLNTVLYPKSANAFDSLGEAYLVQGNIELAIINFNSSLQLDPKNQNALDKLKILQKK